MNESVSLAAPGKIARAAADRRAPNPGPVQASGVLHKRRRHDSIDCRHRVPLAW